MALLRQSGWGQTAAEAPVFTFTAEQMHEALEQNAGQFQDFFEHIFYKKYNHFLNFYWCLLYILKVK